MCNDTAEGPALWARLGPALAETLHYNMQVIVADVFI